jgi:glycosyltransferase involved in cell wall biosynthesis
VLHVTSTEEARESVEKLPALSWELVPNGVEVPESVCHVPRTGPLRLLFLGRLHQKKGIENLFEACKLLDRAGLDWNLKVVGTGEATYTESLRQRVSALGLATRVDMTGQLVGEQKRQVFESSDLAVFPSFTENFGMVIAEALAHGVPVIASTGTPWKEVEAKRCGVWVDNAPETVAAAIESLNRAPLEEFGSRGRDWMIHDFSWDSMGRRMAEIYARMANRS